MKHTLVLFVWILPFLLPSGLLGPVTLECKKK